MTAIRNANKTITAAFDLGEMVRIGPELEEIEAQVTAYSVRPGRLIYEVAYWDDKKRVEVWLDRDEIRPCP